MSKSIEQTPEIVEISGVYEEHKHEWPGDVNRPGTVIGWFKQDGRLEHVGIKASMSLGTLLPGMRYKLSGRWTKYKPKHKFAKEQDQFIVVSLVTAGTLTHAAFSAYVNAVIVGVKKEASELGGVPHFLIGIGQSRIDELWKVFGEKALEKIRLDSGLRALREYNLRCQGNRKISEDSWIALQASLNKSAGLENATAEVLGIIAGYYFPHSTATEAVKRWGFRAGSIIKRDPFKLMTAKFSGCGFKRCDELYKDLGLNPHRLKRAVLKMSYDMENGIQGNVWTERRQLKASVEEIVAGKKFDKAVKLGVRAGLLSITKTDGVDGPVISDESSSRIPIEWVSHSSLAKDEAIVAKIIADRLDNHTRQLNGGGLQFINRFSELGIPNLSSHQRSCLNAAISPCGMGLLIGGPGTGKTRVVTSLISLALACDEIDEVIIGAPTGKASSRTRNLYRQIYGFGNLHNASFGTWHSMLWQMQGDVSTDTRLIIGDETGMNDISLMARILEVNQNAIILLVGDDGQLPPVGAGHPLRDLIRSPLPCGRLTETHRNDGAVVTICEAIRQNRSWQPHGNIDLSHCTDPEEFFDRVASIIAGQVVLGRDKVRDIQVIVPINDSGPVSKRAMNEGLQALLNKDGEKVGKCPFMVGDKVVCRKNGTYEEFDSKIRMYVPGASTSVGKSEYVANGDQGVVTQVSTNPWSMVVELTSKELVIVPFTDSEENRSSTPGARCSWELAYAISGHSSQGSEWPYTIVCLDPSNPASGVANREWLYTALSRMQEGCTLIGTMDTARKYCKRSGVDRRKTFLKERIAFEESHLFAERL